MFQPERFRRFNQMNSKLKKKWVLNRTPAKKTIRYFIKKELESNRCHLLLRFWKWVLKSMKPDRTEETWNKHLLFWLGWLLCFICQSAWLLCCLNNSFSSLFCPIFSVCIVLYLAYFFTMKMRWIFNDSLEKLLPMQSKARGAKNKQGNRMVKKKL